MMTRYEMTIADNRDSTKCLTISRPIRVGGVQTKQTGRLVVLRNGGKLKIRDRHNSPIPNLGMKVSLVNNLSDVVSLRLLLEAVLQGLYCNLRPNFSVLQVQESS
jgi:hypothetical protein